jgi:Arc/MetJ family transcription regulator
MRTTINLDSAVLESVCRATGVRSRSRAAKLALEDFLRRGRLKKILDARGTFRFHPKTAEWRHIER